MKFNVTINTNEIKKAINKYKRDTRKKEQEFLRQLASQGVRAANPIIRTAKKEVVGLALSPTFTMLEEDHLEASLAKRTAVRKIGTGRYEICVEYSGEDALFIEFSAGMNYGTQTFPDFSNGDSYGDGFGVGTYPGQTHAFDPNGWFYLKDGKLYQTVGNKAYMPMYYATEEMLKKIISTANAIF